MLKLIHQDLPPPELSLLVESPVPGVVLIDAVVDHQEVPLHWRAGMWDNPPLDVSLAPDERLAGVQFVLQDETVPRANGGQLPVGDRDSSWPVFDVASWPD